MEYLITESPAEYAARNHPVVRSNPEMTIWEELEDQRSALSYKEECVLYSKGWHHTSNNPLSIWMWEKTIEGQIYRCNRRFVLQLQEKLDNDEA